MKHYIDENNEIRAIELGQEFLIKDSWIEVAVLGHELEKRKPKQTERDIKSRRDALLSETDWYVIRFQETGVEVPANVLTYRQELRDITLQEGYPENVEWPVLV